MSDSIEKESHFDAAEFAKSICENTKLIVLVDDLEFGKGWAEIFSAFIQKVRNYSIYITTVNDKHNFLDIEVDLKRSARAKPIYQAILRAKWDSARICSQCGQKKPAYKTKLCSECNKNAGKLKVTGTWLDKF